MGHIADVDRPTTSRVDHDVRNRIGGFELARHSHEILHIPHVDGAAGYCHVLVTNRVDDIVESKIVELELRQIYVDLHLPLQPAGQRYVQYTRDLFQTILQLFGHVTQPHEIVIPRNVHLHDRELGQVDLEDLRVFGGSRQVGLGNVHLLADLLAGLVHVGARIKLDVDARVPLNRS